MRAPTPTLISPQKGVEYPRIVRKLFLLLLMVGLGAVVLAVVAPSLPEGNPLRLMGDNVRGIGEWMGRGFGGGYTELTPG